MEKLGISVGLCTPFFFWGGGVAASDLIFMNKNQANGFYVARVGARLLCETICFWGDWALLFWNATTVFTPVRMTRTKWKNKPEFSFGCPNMLNPSKETPQRTSVCTCVS